MPLREEAELIDSHHLHGNDNEDSNNKALLKMVNFDHMFDNDEIRSVVKTEKAEMLWFKIFGSDIVTEDLKKIHELLFKYFKLIKK